MCYHHSTSPTNLQWLFMYAYFFTYLTLLYSQKSYYRNFTSIIYKCGFSDLFYSRQVTANVRYNDFYHRRENYSLLRDIGPIEIVAFTSFQQQRASIFVQVLRLLSLKCNS